MLASAVRRVRPFLGQGVRSFSVDSRVLAENEGLLARLFVSSKMPSVPLTSPFPGVSVPEDVVPSVGTSAPQTSVLSNGLRVVSLPSFAPGATIGVAVDLGSRYETESTAGFTEFLQNMAFSATETRTSFKVLRDISRLGGSPKVNIGREYFVASLETNRNYFPPLVELLADVSSSLRLNPWEVNYMKKHLDGQVQMHQKNVEQRLLDQFHVAAFSKKTLGRPLYATAKTLELVDDAKLQDFRSAHYSTGRLAVVGVGVPHEELLKATDLYFNKFDTATAGAKREAAQYTGGEKQIETSDESVQVILGFQSPGTQRSKDAASVAVLQALLGGSCRKLGQFSRFNQNVLQKHSSVSKIRTLNLAYSDAALFGVHYQAAGNAQADVAQAITHELLAATNAASAEELARAKAVAKSMSLMSTQSRSSLFESLSSQYVRYGSFQSAADFNKQIDEVTAADVAAVAVKIVSSAPTVVSAGAETITVPRYDQFAKLLRL